MDTDRLKRSIVPPSARSDLNPRPKRTDLALALAGGVGTQERNDSVFAKRRAGVADVQMRVCHPHEDSAGVLSRVGRFKNGIGGVLNDLEDLAVAIAAGEHRLLRTGVLSDELRLDLVDLEDFGAVRFYVGDKGRVRRGPPSGRPGLWFVPL
jgi:hypothetical protein